jgi:hypothetical protein
MKLRIFAFIVVALFVIGGFIWFGGAKAAPYDSFAQCLTQKGVKMYGAFWCPHCSDQKALFGSSVQYIDYVECSNKDRSQNELCVSLGIKVYPTWEFADGKLIEGNLEISQLAAFSQCAV